MQRRNHLVQHRQSIRSRVRAVRPLILERPPSAGDSPAEDALVIICPWLAGLPARIGLWVSALPIHDVNGFIEDDARYSVPPALATTTYFGVLAIDPFRASDAVFRRLRSKGIDRIVNLPSVSFFDGHTAEIFASLDLGPAQERAFLQRAKGAGLNVGLCARTTEVPPKRHRAEYDFILCHDGPGSTLELIDGEIGEAP